MNRTPKKSVLLIETLIAIVLAIYILFPFYMVVINSSKTTTAIGNDPVTLAGASLGQLFSNIHENPEDQ